MSRIQRPTLLIESKSCIKEVAMKKQLGWSSTKNESQETIMTRQLQNLFSRQVVRLSREMRGTLADLDVNHATRTLLQQAEDLDLNRQKLYLFGVEKLCKAMLQRNTQHRKSLQSYEKDYNDMLFRKDIRASPPRSSPPKDQSPERICMTASKPRIRPLSSKTLKHISKSVMWQRNSKCRDGMQTPHPPTSTTIRITEVDSHELPRFCSYHLQSITQKNIKPNRTSCSPDNVLRSDLQSSRTTLLQFSRQFLPGFTYRKAIRGCSSNSCEKPDSVQQLKDRIRLLNSDVPIKALRQQGYRKKYRDPRPFTNFFL